MQYFGILHIFIDVNPHIDSNLHIDNRSLVEECIRGDKEALNLFYLRFAPRMLAVIRRYISSQKDAEDILHDGFIVAFTRLKSLRDFDRVDFWLATIMKNLSLRFLQSQDVAAMLHDLPEIEDTPDITEIISLDTLEELMRKMPDGYQKVFRLAVLENKSHKEIAALLGIAPNTSSSQLFHAKVMMRRLITDYRRQAGLLTLLLAGSLTALWLLRLHSSETIDLSTSAPVTAAVTPAQSQPHLALSIPIPARPSSASPSIFSDSGSHSSALSTAEISTSADSRPQSSDATSASVISLSADNSTPDASIDSPDAAESSPADRAEPLPTIFSPLPSPSRSTGWAIGVSANIGLASGGNSGYGSGNQFMSNSSPWLGDAGDSSHKPDPKPIINGNKTHSGYNYAPHRNSLPVAVALSVSRRLNSTLSIETGITYTYLHSAFESLFAQSDCRWHYVGIPLKLNINIYSNRHLRFYASAGARVDIPLSSRSSVTNVKGTSDLAEGSFHSPLQWSLMASPGVAWRMTDKVELFLEPTVQYNFKSSYTVPNIWTDNTFSISLPIGLRLTW